MIPAILMMLCCRLMMISLANKLCHVPFMKCRMNMSSTAVSDGLLPSFIFAETRLTRSITWKRESSVECVHLFALHTGVPRVPWFSMSYIMRRICHLVCQWLISFQSNFVFSRLWFRNHCAFVKMSLYKSSLSGR